MKVFTRVAGLVVLGAVLLIGPTSSPAATPASGAIGPAPGSTVSWTGGPYVVPQPVPDGCPPPSPLCDHFSLTVNVPASYWDSNTGGADILIEWASADDDFDLYVYDNSGTQSARRRPAARRRSGCSSRTRTAPAARTKCESYRFFAAAATDSGTATFVSQAGGPAPNPVRTTGGLAFSPPATVVDAQRTEGEPLNFIDRIGNYWESGPYGFSTAQSFIHRSTDGGNQFNIVSFVGLRPNAPPGGGDTDVVIDDQGDAYFVDLEGLAELSCAVQSGQRQQLDHEPGLCYGHCRRPPVVRAWTMDLSRGGH